VHSKDIFADASAAELAAAVRAKSVGALELTDAAIARIEALDGAINAVVVRDFDRARDQARKIDLAVARGAELPLAGVPMTVKECFNIAGLPTTFGMEFARDYRPSEDAAAVRRLKNAGAVIVGKTNVAPGLADYQSDNPIYGRTKNPHDLTRSPGGSSGGSAAALAAGMVPLELGGDAGGSIRVPASFCGVFGHLSSFGIISLEGHGPPLGGVIVGQAWAAAGPMARTANDLALALGVLAGPEGRNATGYRLSLPAPRHERLCDYRVLILTEHPTATAEDEIVAAIQQLAAQLEGAGASVSRASDLLPSLAESQALVEKFVWTYKTGMDPSAVQPKGTVKDYFDCLTAQELLRRKWDALFRSFDVVIAPCYSVVAFPYFAKHDPWPGHNRTLRINGREIPYAPQHAWPLIAGMPHLPATAAPIGRTRDGLPIGAQIIGPFLEDLTPIGFAALLSKEFGMTAEIARAQRHLREDRRAEDTQLRASAASLDDAMKKATDGERRKSSHGTLVAAAALAVAGLGASENRCRFGAA
jgi:amidase